VLAADLVEIGAGFAVRQGLGVDGDPDGPNGRIREAAARNREVDHLLDRRQRMLDAAHMGPGRLVADHEGVGWAPCSRPRLTPANEGMEQGSLPLDEVPVRRMGLGRQPFDGARDEVGHHRVDRDAAARDEDAGLTRGAEIGVSPRARISRSSASAVYFLPAEQSVPTVRSRRPDRFVPLPVAKRWEE
jgi:hypothetical protein